MDWYRKTVKIYRGKSFSLNPDGEGMSEIIVNPIQTGGGGGLLEPPSGKIVITPTPKEL